MQPFFGKMGTQQGTWSKDWSTEKNLISQMIIRPEVETAVKLYMHKKLFLTFMTDHIIPRPSQNRTVTSSTLQWQMMEYARKPNTLVAGPGISQPGINGTLFTLQFEEDLWDMNMVIRAPRSGHLVMIMSDSYRSGGNYCYKAQLVTFNKAAYLDPADVQPGAQWVFSHSAFPEFSDRGIHAISGPSHWFENHTTIMRQEWEISGSAAANIMIFSYEIDGKTFSNWISLQDWHRMRRWSEQMENHMWFGVSSIGADGESTLRDPISGRPIITGSGFLEQIKGGYSAQYTKLTKPIMDSILQYATFRHREAEGAEITLVGGTLARRKFHQAIEDHFKFANVISDNLFISRTGKGVGLRAGFEYVEYDGLAGSKIKFVTNPMFDDPRQFPDLDPETQLPIQSGNFYLFNYGDYAGEPNIQILARGANGFNRGFLMWYEGGSIVPGGGTQGSITSPSESEMLKMTKEALRSNGRDGYRGHYLREAMLKIHNPASLGAWNYVPANLT